MKIDEVISLYAFLGNLNWWGFLGCVVLVDLFVYLVFLSKNNELNKKLVLVILMVIPIAVTILYLQARERNRLLVIGNDIKQNLFDKLYKEESFAVLISGSSIQTISEDDFYALESSFPQEFLVVNLKSGRGIRLTDTKTLEKLNENIHERALQTGELISNYLRETQLSALYVDDAHAPGGHKSITLQKLDNHGYLVSQDFYRQIYNQHLVPIYSETFEIIGFKLIKSKPAEKSGKKSGR